MEKIEKIFLILTIITSLILIYILYRDRKKYGNRKDILERLNSIPAPKKVIKTKEKSNIIVIQPKSENNQENNEYFISKNIDYMIIEDDEENIWKFINYLFENTKYEYICYLNANLLVIDKSKDFKRLISQSGDNDMILCRDENKHNEVSLNAVIFRNSEWTKYKLRQLFYKGEKYDIIMDQIYTGYDAGDVLSRKEFIDIGLPFMCSGICVYNEHAFNSRKSSFIVNIKNKEDTISIYPWNGISGFTEIPKNIEKLREWNGNRKIPKYIFQTMETTLISDDMNKFSRQRLIDLNPGYEYFYFDALDCRKFIKDNFDKKVFKAYDKLLAGAFKADLFRYCLLYKYGGVYCDINFMPLESFDTYISDDLEFVIPDDPSHGLWQGFFAIKPKSDLLKITIDLTVKDILEEVYISKHTGNAPMLAITGPQKIGACLNIYLNLPVSFIHRLGIHNTKKLKFKILNFFNEQNGESHPFIFDKERNKRIAINKFMNYYPKTNSFDLLISKESYSNMFNKRRIYKFNLI